MTFKLKHYAQPVLTNIRSIFESAMIEFAIGVICACFAYVTYDEIIQLFVATAGIAVVCFFLTLHNIYVGIRIYRDKKRKAQQTSNSDVREES